MQKLFNLFWRNLGLIGLLLLAPAVAFCGTGSFNFHVEARPAPKLPTGQIKITIETDKDVTGSTVTVSDGTNSAMVTIGTIPSGTLGSAINADLVLGVKQADNNNNVVLLIVLNSQFASSLPPPSFQPNFCTLAAGKTGVEDFLVTINVPGNVTGYRRNSYTAPSTLDCNQAYVRISSNQGTWDVPALLDHGRNPLDLVLILDNSGSMELPPPGVFPVPPAPYNTRYGVLSDVVDQFVTLWESLSDPTVQQDPSDRIGLVFYSTTAQPASFTGAAHGACLATSPGSGIFVVRGSAPPGSSHNWCKVIDAVKSNGPTNMTAIGLGLIEGINDATTGPNKSTNDVELILMTDGLQNIQPCLLPSPSPFCPEADPVPPPFIALDFDGTVPVKVVSKHIPIQTVAFGFPAATEHTLLDTVSNQTAASSLQTRTLSETSTAFTDSLMAALKGNSVSLGLRSTGTIESNATSSPPLPYLLDGSVKRATFVLGWEGQGNALDLQLIPPGGCGSDTAKDCKTVPPVRRIDSAFWTIQSIDIPASGPTGNWSLKVTRRPVFEISSLGAPPLQTLPAVPYYLSMYIVEGKLSYRIAFPPNTPGTGDSIVMTADMSYQGKPLTGLGNGIKVQIARPGTGLGTVLHDTNVDSSVLNNEPTPGDKTTPYERKILYLANTTNLMGTIEPQPIPNTFVMKDDGSSSSGDVKADDGVYTVKFPDTSKPGKYQFLVIMDWDNPVTGRIHRIERLEREVKVTPDSAGSTVKVTKGAGVGQWSIFVDPADKFGNYMGPAFANVFDVKISGGGSVSGPPLDPKQTGSYEIKLVGVPSGTDPGIVITVDGHEIRNCKLSKCGSHVARWAVFADFGAGIPTGNFSNVVNTGFSFNGGLEYIFNPHVSAEGILGVHHFPGKIAGDVTAVQFGGGGKVFLNPGHPNLFFARAGVAGYHFTSGTTNVGGYFGVGLLHEFNAHLGLEGLYTFHLVNTPGAATQFSTVQAGVRYAF